MLGSMITWRRPPRFHVTRLPLSRPQRQPATPAAARTADRRQWAQVFDDHAAALLALANLLVLDEATAEAMTGVVLTSQARSNAPAGTDTRRRMAIALIAACQRAEDSLALPPGALLDKQGRAAVGLAIFARLTYREVANEMGMPERHALVLLRSGLLELGDVVPAAAVPSPGLTATEAARCQDARVPGQPG